MAKSDDYILRITGASAAELVVISYDIMLDEIAVARNTHDENPEEYISAVNTAREVLGELVVSLDHSVALSSELLQIYQYVNTLLMNALIYEKKAALEDAEKILDSLRDGWKQAAATAPAGESAFANAPKVYSGLTYGRKGANDYVDQDPNRGIKA